MLVLKHQYGVMICSCDMRMVKYPYSNLKHHHFKYWDVVNKFFIMMFDEIDYQIIPQETGYLVKIFNVEHQPYFNVTLNRLEFEIIKKRNQNEFVRISKDEIFDSIYFYLSDLTPYFNFELYVIPFMEIFKTKEPSYKFDLKTDFMYNEIKKDGDNFLKD